MNDWPFVVAWVVGMSCHMAARYLDWRRGSVAPPRQYFEMVFMRKKFVTAQVLSLMLLSAWMSEWSIAGLEFAKLLPHTKLVAFGMGYMSDSLTKHLVQRIPWLKSNNNNGGVT